MTFMGPKRSTFLFVIVVASLFSVSLAGGQQRFFEKYAIKEGSVTKESPKNVLPNEQDFAIRSRILKANTHDYGSYDPSPSLAKPPFKLIPN